MHKTTERFWRCFYELPEATQNEAEKQFELLKTSHHHPSLHFKRIGVFWSVRVSLYYRALAIKDGEDYIWVWIGSHDEYERLLKEQK